MLQGPGTSQQGATSRAVLETAGQLRELRLSQEQREGKEPVRVAARQGRGGVLRGGRAWQYRRPHAQPLPSVVQVFEGRVSEGDPNSVGHVITTVGGSGTGKQTIRYVTERVVGNGSFGVVYCARCLETGETVRGRMESWNGSQSCAEWAKRSRHGGAAVHWRPQPALAGYHPAIHSWLVGASATASFGTLGLASRRLDGAVYQAAGCMRRSAATTSEA